MKIVGNTVGMGLPKPDLMQTNPKKGDFVKGKEEFLKLVGSGGNVDQSGKTALDTFLDNVDVDYAYDADTGANYTIIRIYKNKIDGSVQYPFVYAPNGAGKGTQNTKAMTTEKGFMLAINAGVFDNTSGDATYRQPDGIVIQNGVVVQNSPAVLHEGSKPLTISADGTLGYAEADADAEELVAAGIVSAVCGFMPIIIDYEAVPDTEWNSIGHYTQNAQRQIIGQFGNGDYAIVTCEGRDTNNSDGWTIAEAQTICRRHGLKFAYNLDGGGSSETMLGLKHLNTYSSRIVPTFIVFNGTTTPPAIGEDTHTHSYTATVTTAATCTTAGVRTYTCSCGNSYTESIPATGHNYVDGICTVCGVTDPTHNPEVVLTSISATYSGGNVTAGTAVNDLTGIVVTAHYSDGTSEPVTGYALSGTIAEGSNTITVSYGGMTTTFTVTGAAASFTPVTVNAVYTFGVYIKSTTSGISIAGNGSMMACTSAEEQAISASNETYTLYPVPIPSGATCVTCNFDNFNFDGYVTDASGIKLTSIGRRASGTVYDLSNYANAAYLSLIVCDSSDGSYTVESDTDTSGFTVTFS